MLTFTVLNGEGPCAAAARFLDEDGEPVKGLKITIVPTGQQVTETDNAPQSSPDANP